MKRRFGLISTRLAILALLVIAVIIGRDAIFKRLLVAKAQSWIGAKVEIGQFSTVINERKLYIRDLAIADPREPMTNLIQAESASLTVDWDSLLRKQFVVNDGVASEVVFAAPRTLSGQLTTRTHDTSQLELPASKFQLSFERSLARDQWLDRFQHSSTENDSQSLEVEQSKSEILNRWDNDLQQHRQRITELKEAIREVHDIVTFDPNPLRSKHLEQAEQLLKKLDNDVQQLASSLAVLDQQVIADRDQLQASKSNDESRLVVKPSQKQLNGDILSKILLHDFQIKRTEEILDWYYGFREMIPDVKSDFATSKESGQIWSVPGWQPTAGFHIKQIQIDGEGRIAGSSFNFAGLAKNITSNPVATGLPTAVELRAQGKAHAFVNYSLDATGDHPIESLHINCPDLPLDSQTLGDEQSLTINVSPCRTNVEMFLSCDNGELTGTMRFDHSNLIMQIQHLDELAGGIATAQRINLELASISDYSVTAEISGTEQAPFVSIKSNLGDHLALKFNEIMGAKSLTAQNQIDETYRRGVAMLNEEISRQVRQLAQQFEQEVVSQKTNVAEDLSDRRDRGSQNRLIR